MKIAAVFFVTAIASAPLAHAAGNCNFIDEVANCVTGSNVKLETQGLTSPAPATFEKKRALIVSNRAEEERRRLLFEGSPD